MIPFTEYSTGKRKFTSLKGKIKVNKNFDESLLEDIIEDFYLGKL